MELIYPAETATVLGPESFAAEMFPVVDASGFVLGQASRTYCHSGVRVLHPVVHLQIVDRFSRFYLQHRSEDKDMYPGLWDIAVGGHVSYGESFAEALLREAGEELGLFDFHPHSLGTTIYDDPEESELAAVYVAVGSYDLHPDHNEVQETRLWTMDEIDAAIGTGIFTPSFEKEYSLYKDRILAML